ncbi:MAG TPA: molybdopterin-synthase adenylyltransferase MoeB [Thermoleophilaceae bacterium]|nr:molybdopterin-synthase adenylyltransferase MoeB [Thermoleophilaceae bacterium]
MASGAELIRQVKEQIREVDPREVHEISANGSGNGAVIVDVREQHEFEESHLPGAVHVPRGHLESRIEGSAPDKDAHVVLYCSTGNRSALAAKTMQDLLGYKDVASMRGGITLWKDRGYDVEVPRALTAEQRERYSRHLLIPEIGLEGQLKLLDSKVLLLGAGGLGSPAALYLAAAGVGTLGIVDNDVVDLSNLQRQVAHANDRIGMPKVDSAEISIEAINPDVKVEKHAVRLGADNVMDIIRDYDVVVDGLDNFPTRYLLNDASVRLGIPVVSASILGFDGQLSVFKPHDGPCYRCLYPTPPPAELAPSCGAAGVLGVLPGVMGLLQSVEVIKLATGAGDPLIGRLLLYDALGATFTELKVRRDPDCPICSRDPADISEEEMGVFPDYEAFCAGAG